MSFKPMQLVQGEWSSNALRFATEEEALANAKDLFNRWTLSSDFRVEESPDPVNYRWVEGALKVIRDEWVDPETGSIVRWWSKDGAWHACVPEADGALRWQPDQFNARDKAIAFAKAWKA